MTKNIRLPSRVQLTIEDDTPGMYPTVPRVGDQRTGFSSLVPFDDTMTLLFATGSIAYPAGTFVSSTLGLNQTSSIVAQGSQVKGVADALVSVSFVQSISPFDETRHPEQSTTAAGVAIDPFYASGSDLQTVGPGFQGRLGSKTKLVIDLSPNTETTFTPRNLSPSHAAPSSPSYPMAYFNHSLRQWEGILQGIPYDFTATGATKNAQNLVNQTLCFSHWASSSTDTQVFKSYAQPSNAWGFPYDARYHATSSQLYSMSSIIDRPFVLEKLVYEFSASCVDTPFASQISVYHPSINTFFILNQRAPFPLNLRNEVTRTTTDPSYVLTASLPQSIRLTANSSDGDTVVNDIRELVTFMQTSAIARFSTTQSLNDASVELMKRDLNFVLDHRTDSGALWTGSFAMSASCRSPGINPSFGVALEGDYVLGWTPGNRTGAGIITGRSLVEDAGGNLPAASFVTIQGSQIVTNVSQSHVDPYILLPTDKLIFGWEVGDDTPIGDGQQFTLKPGSGRLVLYGSLLRQGVQKHDSLNEPLTSNAVHEAIGATWVSDQYDVEPRQQFSGSMSGEYVTGTMDPGGNTRGVIASTVVSQSLRNIFVDSITGGGGGTTGFIDPTVTMNFIPGFLRGYQSISQNERFFDTLMPALNEIVIADGVVLVRHGGSNQVTLGQNDKYYQPIPNGDGVTPITTPTDATWNRAFPFEPRYSALRRQLDVPDRVFASVDFFTNTTLDSNGADVTKDPKPITLVRQIEQSDNFADDYNFMYLFGGESSVPTQRDLMLHFFGIGNYYSGTVEPATFFNTFGNNAMYGSRFRGFKYGIINPLPQFSKTIHRRNSYGQFRDMLEQRIDAKFYDVQGLNPDGTMNGRPGQTSSPVRISFVKPRSGSLTSPSKTWSSNLSNEATSSLPYFDGVVRNREDPLSLSNINTP